MNKINQNCARVQGMRMTLNKFNMVSMLYKNT